MTSLKPIVLIPARLHSVRLPNKPLADIGGIPMISHCYQRAVEAGIGDVYVAAAEQEIVDVITCSGGKAVLTDPDLPSGSDRVAAALQEIDPAKHYNYVVNFQGDLPLFPAQDLRFLLRGVRDDSRMVRTLVTKVNSLAERDDPSVVKAQVAFADEQAGRIARVITFSRALVPWGEGLYWHHVGIYGYPRDILEAFVRLPPSLLEKRERLEQLRLLENGYGIEAVIIEKSPTGVDTPEDLATIRALWKARA